jgi:CDP-L-myo-inositol myo-inositolphosphotransferase|tara:strand:- start:778 stop:2136 length:1359 start_codon:yes stop_codon:yes gene_type:complete
VQFLNQIYQERIVMKCLIIAAGQGTRLRTKCEVKPLVRLLGVPLIERVIRTTMQSGVWEFYVVTGYQGEKVGSFLKQLAKRLNIAVTIIHNEDWKKENGVSVLKAKDAMMEPFLLLMADHLFDTAIIRSLQGRPLNKGEVLLAVDTDKNNPLVDIEDATKVCIRNGHILNIGKTIDDFNGFDTGFFICTPAIFEALERACKIHNDTTLSAAIRVLAEDKHAKSVQTKGFWIDVDNKNAFQKAEKTLLDSLQGKNADGPVSRWLNRPVSIRLSKVLVNFNITPNQISFFSFMLSMVAAGLFALGDYSYLYLALGGIVAQFASIIDGSDGEVARLKYLSSDYGGWFDAVLDRYADAFLLLGLTWYVYNHNQTPIVLGVGFLAIIGSFMVSYTADKYDRLMANRIVQRMRMGRDVRVFLIFLGAVLNQPYALLIVIAVLMNLETIRRIVICRNDK